MPAFRDDDPALVRLELQAVPRGTAVSEVAKQLTALLTGGDLIPGSRLPPERQLAEELGVGRSAVREALAALEILGIVTVRPGSGTYLRDNASELLPTTLSWGLMLSASRTAELAQVRSGLEAQAARLAAENVTEEELENMRGFLATMEDTTADLPAFIEADARFHLQLASSSGNVVLRDLLQSIRSLLRVWVDRGLRSTPQAEDALAEHRTVFAAVEAGDGDAAERAMHEHMSTASRRLEDADADG
ncbi:FadR/GntR family transcriptional regulator [Mycetocola reblochoni]|uniref:Transcriptional regulator, GntR family n=2 Tax=Mycetocola reblochoni TaxID=331618 RepID=A0A1R4K7Y3_9MICO|nr:FadR/GntR family transcriptional regulator [Mycetocola reblochoni]RLP67834.1 FadR family transcriptional regulator [Mycetocola reblochoni]SJN40396.1 Transcriptional regulator, GntR family [Mycetocola reblochoni REB411]